MTNTLAPAVIDQDAILRHLKLNPSDPNTQALLLVCDRYHLDPLLKHMVLIQGTPYITRDGYLAVAHRSGVFDGIEVLDIGETTTHYTAKVSVYRRDMSHPFTYVGRYKKGGGNKEYGPEMAVKCAEVMALRRAFNVTGLGAADERWDVEMDQADVRAPRSVGVVEVDRREIEVTTGEILPQVRRREPPVQEVPEGYVDSVTAKNRLVAAFVERGVGPDAAKASAKEVWGARGRDPVTEELLASMIDLLGPVEDPGAPFE